MSERSLHLSMTGTFPQDSGITFEAKFYRSCSYYDTAQHISYWLDLQWKNRLPHPQLRDRLRLFTKSARLFRRLRCLTERQPGLSSVHVYVHAKFRTSFCSFRCFRCFCCVVVVLVTSWPRERAGLFLPEPFPSTLSSSSIIIFI